MSILTADHTRAAFAAGRFVRLVNWHNTPESMRETVRAELSWYLARYHPLLPEDLERFVDTGEWQLNRPGFIPTFYDSYANHATVAAPVCEELGISGWFFPPTAFLDVPREEQQAYARAHWIQLVPEEFDQSALAMTWDQLAVIAKKHVVGAHTANHTLAADITTATDIEREITTPIRQLRELTGKVPPGFAFLAGTVPDPATPAGAALMASGVPFAVTNTAYIRIAD